MRRHQGLTALNRSKPLLNRCGRSVLHRCKLLLSCSNREQKKHEEYLKDEALFKRLDADDRFALPPAPLTAMQLVYIVLYIVFIYTSISFSYL
jgi:hypothetical protein